MAAKAICDGCGKEEPMESGPLGQWFKPHRWYKRADEDGIQMACSMECVDKIAEKTGKTRVVMPF